MVAADYENLPFKMPVHIWLPHIGLCTLWGWLAAADFRKINENFPHIWN